MCAALLSQKPFRDIFYSSRRVKSTRHTVELLLCCYGLKWHKNIVGFFCYWISSYFFDQLRFFDFWRNYYYIIIKEEWYPFFFFFWAHNQLFPLLCDLKTPSSGSSLFLGSKTTAIAFYVELNTAITTSVCLKLLKWSPFEFRQLENNQKQWGLNCLIALESLQFILTSKIMASIPLI